MRYEYRVLLRLLSGKWTPVTNVIDTEYTALGDLRLRREAQPDREFRLQKRLVRPWEDVKEQQDGEA